MKLFFGVIVFVVAAFGLAALTLVWLAVDREPVIDRAVVLSPEHVARAKKLFEANDPRRLRPGDRRAVVLNQEDVDAAALYLVNRYLRGSSRVVLQPGFADIVVSIPLPANPIGRYANIHAEVGETPHWPKVLTSRVGKLPIPNFVFERLIRRAASRAWSAEDLDLAGKTIRQASFGPRAVRIVYEWQDGLADRARAAVVPPDEVERLRAYHRRIVEVTGQGDGADIPLPSLLEAVHTLAAARITSGDPIAENRAALIALTAFATGRGLELLTPEARHWDAPVPRQVTLGDRQDFAQHFLVSASLAAAAGTALADAVGLYKEIDDSRGGSGFSFNDIAADAAGTLFGKIAVASPEAARALQKRLATTGIARQDIFPEVADLPEFMPEAEFKARFGGVGAPQYEAMMADIRRRIDALPIAGCCGVAPPAQAAAQ